MMRQVRDQHTGTKQKRKVFCTRTSLTAPAQRLHIPSTRQLLTSSRCSSHKKQQNMAPAQVTLQMLTHKARKVKTPQPAHKNLPIADRQKTRPAIPHAHEITNDRSLKARSNPRTAPVFANLKPGITQATRSMNTYPRSKISPLPPSPL
jgi:hypothetical protein